MSPSAFLAYIVGAGVLALALLLSFPGVLITWGWFIGWLFLAVILAWFGVDAVDAWFDEESRPASRPWRFQSGRAGQWVRS